MNLKHNEAKRLQNIEKGLPPRSHFSWCDDEKKFLISNFKSGFTFDVIANLHERKISAIAAQLRKMEYISENEFQKYLMKSNSCTEKKITLEEIKLYFNKYRIQCLWYIAHKDNINSILEHGILSHSLAHKLDVPPMDISDPGAQRWRDRVDNKYNRSIHDYAPLYIKAKNPMLFIRKNMQNDICLLQVSLATLVNSEFLITDGNAASRCTQFFYSLDQLSQVPWEVLNMDFWHNYDDGKRICCSEILIYPSVKPEHIVAIHCYSNDTMKYLKNHKRILKLSTEFFF